MTAPIGSETEKPLGFDPVDALSALPFAVLAVDRDSRIAFINNAAEQFFEQGANGLRGRRLNELLPADSPLFSLIAQASSGQQEQTRNDRCLCSPICGPLRS